MAKPKHPKRGKRNTHFKYRNDMRPSRTTGAKTAANPEASTRKIESLTRGQSTLYTASGAAIAAAACALLARGNYLPATFATGLFAAAGGTAAAVAKDQRVQALGQGAMAAAGAQLGLVLLDSHYQETAAKTALAATKPEPKKLSNAEGLPPGALEAAYERARRRVAMAEAASQAA